MTDQSTPDASDNMVRPALFLDRDGVINKDHGYVHRVENFELLPGIAAAIRRFNHRGWRVIVVTNQTGIAQNLYTESDMKSVHDYMRAQLSQLGARLDAIYHCPFHENGVVEAYRRKTDLRKPGPGMLNAAMEEYPTERSLSFLVGDKITDIQAAEAAGLQGFLYEKGDVDAFIEAGWQTMMALHNRPTPPSDSTQ